MHLKRLRRVCYAILFGKTQIHFLQDNVQLNWAILTKDFLADADIPLLSWPAVSPDLNPKENVWAALMYELKQHQLPPTVTNFMCALSCNFDFMAVRL